MSMHKSFRNDCVLPAGQMVYHGETPPAGQVQLQGKTLQKEIEDYQRAMLLVIKAVKLNKENTNCQ